jgi:hypothetical protein
LAKENQTNQKQEPGWIVVKKKEMSTFPPLAPSQELQQTIATNACRSMTCDQIIESGYAVCGRLIPISKSLELSETDVYFDILIQSGVTQKE